MTMFDARPAERRRGRGGATAGPPRAEPAKCGRGTAREGVTLQIAKHFVRQNASSVRVGPLQRQLVVRERALSDRVFGLNYRSPGAAVSLRGVCCRQGSSLPMYSLA